VFTLLVVAGCLASFVAEPGEMGVRLPADAAPGAELERRTNATSRILNRPL
jgi:hypothetical protein